MLALRLPLSGQHDYTNFLLGGGNLAILFVGFHLKTALGWKIALALVGLTSAWAWYANLKRYRTVADTPTSRIVSAPQGYVELVGRGAHPPGERLISPVSHLPCLWYRYRIERETRKGWEYVESGVSHETFSIDDGSGEALIDPDRAEIISTHKDVTVSGDHRTTEWLLIEGDRVYVIGEHVTLGGPNAVLDQRADLSLLLAEWKRDRNALLARFDTNRDGEISEAEWEQARKAAADEVDRTHLDIRMKDGIHLLRKPGHGRPYLIANRDVRALVRHYRLWSWAHLAIIVGVVYGLTVIDQWM